MRSRASTRSRPIIGSLKRLAIWMVILLIWEGAFRAFGWKEWIFPAPSHVIRALVELVQYQPSHGRPLLMANLVSVVRLVEGFALSLLLGLSLGAAMWRWRELDEFLGPLFLGMQTLPSVCWVPLGIIAFGINEAGILFVMVMGSAFAVAIAMRDGLKIIPSIYQKVGLMMGASGLKLYRYVLLPASLPALASSLRQGFSFGWRSLMGAEFVLVTSEHGLGFLLKQGRDQSEVAQVIGIMAIMIVIGMAADRLVFAPLQKKIQARFGLV